MYWNIIRDEINQAKQYITRMNGRMCQVVPQDSSQIILSNKYNDLINETTFHNHNDNNENNNNIDFSIRRSSVSVKPNKQTGINKRPNPVINQHPEREQYFKKDDSSNLSSRKKIRTLADSIPNGIRVREFNKFISDGYARFKCFPGASVSHLNYYSNPTLEDDSPDLVVIHAGINNLLSADLDNASDVEIAEELIKVGQKCVDHGVQKVFISSIIKSRKVDFNRINNINNILEEQCHKCDFIFINNNEINDEHLWKDGIHLKENGKVLLARNFISNINHFLYLNTQDTFWT